MPTLEEITKKVVESLENSLTEHLRGEVKKMIQDAVATEFKNFHQSFQRLEGTMDTWKNDIDFDRETMSAMRVNTDNTLTELKEIRRSLGAMPSRVGEKVEKTITDTVSDSIPQAVSNTFDVTSKKIRVEKKPRTLFGFLKFWKK